MALTAGCAAVRSTKPAPVHAMWLLVCCNCSVMGDVDLHGISARELTVTGFDPAPGAAQLAINRTFDVHFSVAPAGEWITSYSLRLLSGIAEAPGAITVDQLDARVRFTPASRLRPELRYTLYVAEGIRGLDGSALAEPAAVSFTTGDHVDAPDPPPEPVSSDDVQPVWEQFCVRCHAGPSPRAGVDLGTPAAARRSLRNVGSLGSVLPRVRPGDHSRSYLTRKLLGRFGFQGFPMPPDGPALSGEDLRRVADWIDSGAF